MLNLRSFPPIKNISRLTKRECPVSLEAFETRGRVEEQSAEASAGRDRCYRRKSLLIELLPNDNSS